MRRDKFPYSNFFASHKQHLVKEEKYTHKIHTRYTQTYNSNIKSHFLNHIVVTVSLEHTSFLGFLVTDSLDDSGSERIRCRLTKAETTTVKTMLTIYWKLHCSITFCIHNDINLVAFCLYYHTSSVLYRFLGRVRCTLLIYEIYSYGDVRIRRGTMLLLIDCNFIDYLAIYCNIGQY